MGIIGIPLTQLGLQKLFVDGEIAHLHVAFDAPVDSADPGAVCSEALAVVARQRVRAMLGLDADPRTACQDRVLGNDPTMADHPLIALTGDLHRLADQREGTE